MYNGFLKVGIVFSRILNKVCVFGKFVIILLIVKYCEIRRNV